MRRSITLILGAAVVLGLSASSEAATQRKEKHFAVNGRPVVAIQNVANGRIEVKSSKSLEVVVIASQNSDKINFDMEQVGDRVDVTASILDSAAQPLDLETSLLLTVPEETELQLKTENGLIYVEQVMGDMTLESVAGEVHLKEVSGYIIVKTTGGSLVCTQCAGKLEFSSIGGSAQILFDGDFIRTGLYSMKSGKGLVEVRFSGNDSFDLQAHTSTGTVDNQAAAFLKPDVHHGSRPRITTSFRSIFGTVGAGLAKVELSSYSGTIRILKRD
jgi:DUF4097 and DUF4098 domain-containing protein YvlB